MYWQVKQSNVENGNGADVESLARWLPPSVGIFKVNWDVGFNPKLLRMGAGVVVRDDHGRVHAAQSKTLSSYQEPMVVEALVALQAVEFSRDLGLQDIILEGDSLQVVNVILEHEDSWCRFGEIEVDIKLVLGSFRSWDIKHVKWSQNNAAHGLAKESVKEVMDKVWMEEIPLCIFNTIFSEQFALFV